MNKKLFVYLVLCGGAFSASAQTLVKDPERIYTGLNDFSTATVKPPQGSAAPTGSCPHGTTYKRTGVNPAVNYTCLSGTWVQDAGGSGGGGGSALTWQGAWDNGTSYVVNDLVSYNQGTYISVAPSVNITPGTNGAKWQLVAGQGGSGPAAWSPVAAWSSSTAYVSGPPASVVTYGGETYVAVAASSNVTPGTDGAKWAKLAAKGADGSSGGGGSTLLSGTLGAIPATCSVGTLYQATDQMPAFQIYACTATNTWTRQTIPSGTVDPSTCTAGTGIFLNTTGPAIRFCIAMNTWVTISGGVTQTADLSDGLFTRTPTVITFGAAWTMAKPFRVAINGKVYEFNQGPYSCTVANNHNGNVSVYIDRSGTLTCGVSTALASDVTPSTNVTLVTGVASMPDEAFKIVQWAVSSGNYASSPAKVYMAYNSFKACAVGGTGVLVSCGTAYDTVQIDTVSVLRKFTCANGPSSSLPSGATQGDVCWDFIPSTPLKYVCANAAGCTVSGDWKAY